MWRNCIGVHIVFWVANPGPFSKYCPGSRVLGFIQFVKTRCAVQTHWGRVTLTWTTKLSIISSDNGLYPSGRQAIIGTNAEILSIRTNFNDILIEVHTFSVKKI